MTLWAITMGLIAANTTGLMGLAFVWLWAELGRNQTERNLRNKAMRVAEFYKTDADQARLEAARVKREHLRLVVS